MSDPVLALALLAIFFAAAALVHYFKTLDTGLARDARTPLIAGFVCGIALCFIHADAARLAAIAVLLTLASVYVRLTGRESEPADGMTLGAITGGAAALPLVMQFDDALLALAACIIAGAIAGYGITFGLTHVRDKSRQAIVDAVTAVVAIAAVYALRFLARAVSVRTIAIVAVAIVPIVIIAAVFKQWSAIQTELRDEAALGVLDGSDVRATAHPLLRLGRGGWSDARAHREFVRVATKIALRKRQQRGRPDDVARLYQLEVLKLRNQAQEMLRIDRAMRAAIDEPSSS